MGVILSKSASLRCRCLLIAIATCVSLRLVWRAAKKRIASQSRLQELEQAIASARNDRESSIAWARSQAADCESGDFKRISAMTFDQLRDALQTGEITCETSVRVQLASALSCNEHTNSIVRFLEGSIDEARELDRLARTPTYPKPALFGIPLSVKEAVAVKNHRCSFGLSTLLDHRCTEDSYTIERLREAGMMPFCQTNVPTYCMTYNCQNGIYGRTTHPRDARRTPGGSSGGEAALTAARGSRAGIGSDIGGSIRVPAAYAGCCGFKPSPTRMSLLQAPESVPCRPFLVPTEGVLAESPEAVVEMMRSLWSNKFFSKRDAFAVPLDFQEDLLASKEKLRIGYFLTDGFFDSLPCMGRAVTEAAKVLESRGHEIVPFSMGEITRDIFLGVAATVFTDGGASVSEDVKEETLTPMQEAIRQFGRKSQWGKKLISMKCRWQGEQELADLLDAMPSTAIDVQRGVDRIFGCRKRLFLAMKEQGIDALLCPPTYSPATTHEFPNDPLLSVLWNGILNTLWNALDVPVGVVPFTEFNEADGDSLKEYHPKNMMERALKEDCKDRICGMPLLVQFVAPPFRDEIVLRLMFELHTATNLKE